MSESVPKQQPVFVKPKSGPSALAQAFQQQRESSEKRPRPDWTEGDERDYQEECAFVGAMQREEKRAALARAEAHCEYLRRAVEKDREQEQQEHGAKSEPDEDTASDAAPWPGPTAPLGPWHRRPKQQHPAGDGFRTVPYADHKPRPKKVYLSADQLIAKANALNGELQSIDAAYRQKVGEWQSTLMLSVKQRKWEKRQEDQKRNREQRQREAGHQVPQLDPAQLSRDADDEDEEPEVAVSAPAADNGQKKAPPGSTVCKKDKRVKR